MPRHSILLSLTLLFLLVFALYPSPGPTGVTIPLEPEPAFKVFNRSTSIGEIPSDDRYTNSYTITLWQLTEASYKYGNSNELNNFLYQKLDSKDPVVDLGASIQSELRNLLARLTIENSLPLLDQPKIDQYEFLTTESGPGEFTVYYKPRKTEIYETSFCLCGYFAEPFLTLSALDIYRQIPFHLDSYQFTDFSFESLPTPTVDTEPDLTAEFLNILENPDRRVF